MSDAPEKKTAGIRAIKFESQIPAAGREADTLYIPDPPTAARDQLLGQYMDYWSRLEGVQSLLLWQLLGTKISIAFTVFHTLSGAAQFRELALGLSRETMTEREQEDLTKLLERHKMASTKRNRIVHGRWNQEVSVGARDGQPVGNGAEWVRQYDPPDPEMRRRVNVPSEQKARANFRFTLKQIHTNTQELATLIDDFSNFSQAFGGRLWPNGIPG